MTMLSDIKLAVGVDTFNIGFDQELLAIINGWAAGLSQLGVTEFDTLVIEADTEWPEFTDVRIGNLMKPYFFLKVRSTFDPIASETIVRTLDNNATIFEGRIVHTIEGAVE